MYNLLQLGAKRWKLYLLGLFALIVTDFAQVAIPKFILPKAFDIATGEESGNLLLFTSSMVILAIIIAAGRFVWRTTILGSSRVIERDIRENLFSKLLTFSSTFFKEYKTGDIMARATNDLKILRTATGMAFVAIVDSVIMLSITVIIALTSYGLLALLVMSGLALIPVTVITFGFIAVRQYKELQKSYSKITAFVQENLNGIRVIKTLAKEDFTINKFRELNEEYKKRYKGIIKTFGMIFPVITLFLGISSFIMLRFGGIEVLKGNLSVGNFAALNYLMGLMVWPMIAIGYSLNMMMRGRVSMNRIKEILERESDIPYPKTEKNSNKESDKIPNSGAISIRNLNYAYPDQPDKMILKNINIEIKAGEKIGIMGKTGSGKTTLINLIPRILKTPTNSIFLNGKDITTINLHKLRNSVTLVPQESMLFSDTIKNNIAFGVKEDEIIDEKKLLKTSEISTISRDFKVFDKGWETVIGEKGTTVSGGQKQRIAISRALMKQAPIMIFDDSLSSVDRATEEKILEGINGHRKNETMILISHRVSTLKECDKIAIIDDGKIIEFGTSEELLKTKGIYFEIATIQEGGKDE